MDTTLDRRDLGKLAAAFPKAPDPGAPFVRVQVSCENGRWALSYQPGRDVAPIRSWEGTVDDDARDAMLAIVACAQVLAELGEEQARGA